MTADPNTTALTLLSRLLAAWNDKTVDDDDFVQLFAELRPEIELVLQQLEGRK